jgi:hypothetical protein
VNKDTIENIATTSNSNESILFVVLIVGICILLYLLFKQKTPKIFEHRNIETQPETKAEETFVRQEVTGLNSVEVTNVTISKSDTSIIEKTTTEIVKEPQPIIEETITEVVVVEEEQKKEKYIGYNPINIFAQTEPLYFPYVMMPKPNCVIKFPRKGRTGRKGFKEEAFKEYIGKYFKNNYQVYDDRFVLVSNNSKPYEPDFTLINEKEGINIFVDIEIDEPYEGTNDIENRKPTHYKYSDTNRNHAFTNRGWIVIRFAEIQVHQQPDACCKFIAHILKSINPQFSIPESLLNQDKIQPIIQWTEEEAKQWSLEKYRERYLGIERFGITSNNNVIQDFEETELEKAIEEQVEDEIIKVDNQAEVSFTKLSKLLMASVTGKYASFTINGEKRLIKPTYVYDYETSGFCYVKNEVKTYSMKDIENVEIKDNYYTLRVLSPNIGVDKVSNIINTAIEYNKYIRMKYTRIAWQNMAVDTETGELFIDNVEAEESVRTISNVQLSVNVLSNEHIENYRLNGNYLTAYCHKREEQRTFKFDRIGEIEILDI